MAKRATGSTAKASAPVRAPSPASQRKSAAIEAYTKQTGSMPPKGWTTAKIEGRTRTLGYTGVSGTGYTTPRDGRAAAPKLVAPSPADAYRQKFGHAPPSGMSTGAMDRWVNSPMTKAPAPPGAYGPVGSAADRSGSGNAHLQSAAKPAGGSPAKSNLVVPKFFSTNSSSKATRALSNAPSEVYRAVLDAKWRDRDRNTAAQVLRDYRSNQLGRSLGPVARTVMKAANSTTARVATIASAGVIFSLYSESIAKGYMADGMRGAVGTALNKASFGLTDKAYEAITGRPELGKVVDRAFGMRSPGLAGVDHRRDFINTRPTRKMREAIDKTNGVKSPAVSMSHRETTNALNSIGGLVTGTALAIPAVIANTWALHKASSAVMKGVAMVSPTAAKVGARVLPGVGLGLMAVGAGVAAVNAMRSGGSAGQIAKSAAMGAVGLPTGPAQGRLSSDQSKQFASANAKFKAPAQAAAGERRGWSNEARIGASIARGDQNIAYGGNPEASRGSRSGKN